MTSCLRVGVLLVSQRVSVFSRNSVVKAWPSTLKPQTTANLGLYTQSTVPLLRLEKMAREAKIPSLGLAKELAAHEELKAAVEQYSIKPVVDLSLLVDQGQPLGCSTHGVAHNIDLFRVGDQCLSCFVERFPPPAGKEPARKKMKTVHSYSGDSIAFLADDVKHFHELKAALSAGELAESFVRMYHRSGTIANGRCYIAVSRVAGLGLFASQRFAAGDVVTEYGAGLRCARFVRSLGKEALTHARRIPDSDFVRDGRPWAACFEAAVCKLDVAAERKRPAAERTRVLPVDVKALEHVALGRTKTLLLWCAHTGCILCAEQGELPDMLKHSGLGYMSNTAVKAAQNVRIVDVSPRNDGLEPQWMFLVATRTIAAHEEVLSPYNNWDPAVA